MTLQTRTVALADLELDVDINARRHRTDEGIEELKASIRELFWAVARRLIGTFPALRAC
jgi:hypothetical protein